MSTAPRRGGSASASQDAGVAVAMSCSLGELYRMVRDSQRQVWEPASCALARRSEHESEAFAALRDLLISALPELRVRGVVALGAVAGARPAQVQGFLKDRLEESSSLEDPILLEAVVTAGSQLPSEEASTFLQLCLKHPHPSVRIAALGALERTSAWPMAQVKVLVQDSCPEVRAALALLLATRVEDAAVFELMAGLVQDLDPQVRAAVAASLTGDSPQLRFLRISMEADPEEGVRQALSVRVSDRAVLSEDADQPGLQTAIGLEAEIDADPSQTLAVLRPWLGRSGTLGLLRALRELCRNLEAGKVVRALHVLLASSEEDNKTRMLRMVGILDCVDSDSSAGELRSLVATCLSVQEAQSVEQLVAWSQSLVAPTRPGLDAGAWNVLVRLARFCRGLGNQPGLLPLSKAASNVEGLVQQAEHCPRPECEIVVPALENAVDVLGQYLNHLMSGADS